MNRMCLRVIWSVCGSLLALGLSQVPGEALACRLCGGGGGGSYFAGRMMTPMRAGFGPAPSFGPPVMYDSGMSDAGCSSCGVPVADSCGSCSTSAGYATPDAGECQASPAEIGNGKSPTPVEPKDRWKKKTYAPDEAPLGAGQPEASGEADTIRRGAGSSGSTATEAPATAPRGGNPADSEDSPRSTFRPESASPVPQPDAEDRIRIEPRGGRPSTVPTPEESTTPVPSRAPVKTESTGGKPDQGGLSLPQASRLDHVVAAGEGPARTRTVTRKPVRSGQLVRNAEYSRHPWNAEQVPATVAKNP
jgi:hypothetical protein